MCGESLVRSQSGVFRVRAEDEVRRSLRGNHFDSVYFHDTAEAIPIKQFELAVWIDEAVRFIREQKKRGRPFFLWWTCGPPHHPYAAPAKYEATYEAGKVKLRPNWKPIKRFGTRKDIAKYYAMITAIDDQVGQLMKEFRVFYKGPAVYRPDKAGAKGS